MKGLAERWQEGRQAGRQGGKKQSAEDGRQPAESPSSQLPSAPPPPSSPAPQYEGALGDELGEVLVREGGQGGGQELQRGHDVALERAAQQLGVHADHALQARRVHAQAEQEAAVRLHAALAGRKGGAWEGRWGTGGGRSREVEGSRGRR